MVVVVAVVVAVIVAVVHPVAMGRARAWWGGREGGAQVAGELDLPLLRRRDHRLQEVLHALKDRVDGRAEPVVVDRRVVVEVTVEGGVGGVAAADALLRALVLQRGERVAARFRWGEVVGWGQSLLRPRWLT